MEKEFDAADARFSTLSATDTVGVVVYKETACHHWRLWAWVLERLNRHNHTRFLGYYDTVMADLPLLKNNDSLTIEYDGRGLARVSLNQKDPPEA